MISVQVEVEVEADDVCDVADELEPASFQPNSSVQTAYLYYYDYADLCVVGVGGVDAAVSDAVVVAAALAENLGMIQTVQMFHRMD